jgi:biopolymer transport protein ExbD
MAIGRLRDAGGGEDDLGEDGNDSLFAEINITPLTDVFLVMVVIFMVSALAEVEQNRKEQRQQQQVQEQTEQQKKSGLRINLPAGKAQEIDTSKASLVVEVPLSGDVAVGGKTFADAALDNLFSAAFQRDKGTQVIIKADKGVAHGKVVNLMERAKQAGLTHLAIGTSGG